MKKSLSLLVAIAMVFSMFASVAAAATSEAGKKLEGYGVIKGNQNGDLLEDENWLRQDVAVLISRLAGKEDEAKATAKTHTFTDVRGTFYNGYISWAKDNNFMQGNSATNFGFDNQITYKEFATVILRALAVDTSDYSKIGELAVKAGIIGSDLNIDEKAKRGVTYDIVVTALDKDVAGTGKKLGEVLGLPGYVVPAPAIDVKANSVKEVTVTFNKEIDTAKAKFELKRGSVTVAVDKVVFSDDKKVAKLQLANKLVAGDYTVVAKEATDAELSATFSAENEKVAKIELVGDKFALGTKNTGDVNNQEIEISYKVTNQYGDDVTRNYGSSINFQSSKGFVKSQSNGKLVLALDDKTNMSYQITEKVYVSGNYNSGSNNVFFNDTLEVGTQSRVDVVTVKELYHPDGKTISAGSTFSEFTILFEAKDQYGNLITDLNKLKKDLSVYVSNQSIFDIAKERDNNVPDFVNDQGKNKDQIGIKLSKNNLSNFTQEGTNTVIFNSIFTGKQTKFDVEVNKGTAVQSIQLEAPTNVAVGDKKVKVNFTALDGNGNQVTKFKDLDKKITLNSSFGAETFKLVENTLNGNAELQLDVSKASQGVYTIFAYVNNNGSNQASAQVNVAAAPKPNDIKKVDVDRNKVLDGNSASFEVSTSKIKIVDNLSRDWDLKTGYELTLEQLSGGEGYDVQNADKDGNKYVIGKDTKVVVTKAGSARFRVTLKSTTTDNNVELTQDFTISTADLKDLDNFSVEKVSKFFGGQNSPHKKEVKVFGTYNGEKYQLARSQYDVIVPSADNFKYEDGKIVVVGTGYNFGPTTETKEATVKYTVQVKNENHKLLSEEFVVSNEKIKISRVEFKSDNNYKGENGTVTINVTKGATFTNLKDVFDNALKFVDNYGSDYKYDPTITSVFGGAANKFNKTTGAASEITATLAVGDKFNVNYNVDGAEPASITVEVE